MQNSARIQSLVQQLVDALVDEITAEVRMRTGASIPSKDEYLPSFDLDKNMGSSSSQSTPLPSWDDLPDMQEQQPSSTQQKSVPKFETPDFDQLLKDLEELRKPLANKQPPVQDAEVVSQQPTTSNHVGSMPTNAHTDSKPFSSLSGASDLLKRVTGK